MIDWPCCFWAHGEAPHHAGDKCMVEQAAHGSQEAKKSAASQSTLCIYLVCHSCLKTAVQINKGTNSSQVQEISE